MALAKKYKDIRRTPCIFINPKTKEFAVFQDRKTSNYVVDFLSIRKKMVDAGFEFFASIKGDAALDAINIKDTWTQVTSVSWTKEPRKTKADALTYMEAAVVILQHQIDKEAKNV